MASYKIELLNDPDPSVSSSEAHGLNNHGVVAGHVSATGWRAAYWSPVPSVIPLGNVASVAYGVNDGGDVVGTRQASDFLVFPGEAFLFRGGVFHNLANVFAGQMGVATDINNAGVVALWAGDDPTAHAFTYDANSGTVTDLGVLPGHEQSYASAINNAGRVAGISRKSGTPSDSRAFLFDGTMHDLGPATNANDMNDAGQVVGGRVVSGASNWTGYRCDTASGSPQFVDLGTLPGFVSSEAMGINNNGDIVGHSVSNWGSGQQIRAFLYPAGGQMQDLNTLIPANSGWELTWALAINDKGQIAGTGTYNGRRYAYLLTPESRVNPFDQATIDPMALILGGRWYLIWVEMHHPHVPKLADLEFVLRMMPAAEQRATLARARRLGDFGKRIETMISRMIR